MGSKSRIAKYIVPIIQKCIDENNITNYYEPFCGGCNIIDKINCTNRFASDSNPYLIGLFKHLQSDGELLNEVSREIYTEVRKNYKLNLYENWYVGNIGFLASYNGKFFDGGYAPNRWEKTKYGLRLRDYYKEAKNNIVVQKSAIKDLFFNCCDYRQLNTKKSFIYCDPPYANRQQYSNATNFDHDEFWEVIRNWSKDNFVLVSELIAPNDFVCIWEKLTSRSINTTNKSKDTEKLFIYKDGLFAEQYE